MKNKKNSKKDIEFHIKKLISNPKMNTPTEKINKPLDKPLSLNLDKITYNKIVIFDTNFLMLPEQFKIDIFSQAKSTINTKNLGFMIFDKTIYELQKISKNKGRAGISANVALDLINQNKVNIINTNDKKYVDDMLVNYKDYLPDNKAEIIIATQDKELKKRLKEERIPILVMANKSKLRLN
jgi:uncharacterized protein